MEYKVSVIIPVYNTSMYLPKCIESLMHQTLDSVEFIFINDASTDDSHHIIRQYADNYPSRVIKIIDLKQNQGISFARNTGLKNATGEYITHCDSDDWIEPETYETLYNLAKENNADIASCNFIHEYLNSQETCIQPYSSDRNDSIRKLLNGEIFPSLWASIIKRDIIIDNNLHFPIGLNMGEDLLFNIQAYYFSEVLVSTRRALYHYRHSENSVCIRRSRASIESDIKIAGLIDNFLIEKKCHHDYEQDIRYRKFYSKLALIRNFDSVKDFNEWINIYPETNPGTLSYKRIKLTLRIQLWLSIHNMFRIAQLFKYILIWQHRFRTVFLTQ